MVAIHRDSTKEQRGQEPAPSRAGAGPNIALEPTAYSLRSFLASAFGGGSPRALGGATRFTVMETPEEETDHEVNPVVFISYAH